MALWNDLHIWIGSLRERLIMILASGSLLNFTKFEIIFPKHLGDQLQMAPLIRCLITTHLTKGEAPPLPEDLDKPFLIAQRPGASLLLQEAGAKGPQPRPRESVETTLHRMLCVERHAKPVRTQKTDFPRESQEEREGLLGGGGPLRGGHFGFSGVCSPDQRQQSAGLGPRRREGSRRPCCTKASKPCDAALGDPRQACPRVPTLVARRSRPSSPQSLMAAAALRAPAQVSAASHRLTRLPPPTKAISEGRLLASPQPRVGDTEALVGGALFLTLRVTRCGRA